MINTIVHVIVNILIPLAFMGYAGYLVYAHYHPEVVRRRCEKYRSDPKAYAFCQKMYGKQFLILVLAVAASFALELGMRSFESAVGPIVSPLKTALIVVSMGLNLVALYLVFVIFIKKK